MSFPRYPEYKDSGVEWLGEVPRWWNMKRLRFVGQLNPSKSETADLPRDTEVSFLPMEAVGDDGSLAMDRTRPLCEVESGYTYFRDGDVTVAKITPCFENGKGAVMRGLLGGVGFGTTELTVVRPHPEHCSSEYLHWLFTSAPFRKLGEASMYGAGGQKRVPDDFIRDFAMAFPERTEQTAIAAFLDRETGKIDALVAEQEKLIALLKEKRQAVISHAVTKGLNPDAPMKPSGIEGLGDVPAHWTLPPLFLRYSVELGKMLDTSKISGQYLIAYLRNVDVQWGRINTDELPKMDIAPGEFERYTVRDGDLLVCEGGEVGRAAVVRGIYEPIGYQKALHRLRKLNLDESPRFLFYVFRWATATGAFSGEGQSTIAHLTGEQLRKYRFPKPPLEEQHALVEFLDTESENLSSLLVEAERAITLLKERRSVLISAAVTGQIDVRGLVPAETA